MQRSDMTTACRGQGDEGQKSACLHAPEHRRIYGRCRQSYGVSEAEQDFLNPRYGSVV